MKDKVRVTIYRKNDEFVVEYWVGNSMLPVVSRDLLKENIVLNQNGNIEITFKNEESIDKFVEIFNKIKRLIEIISCDLNNEESKVDYVEAMKWIKLSELIDNDSFSKYFSKYEIFEPVIELYLEIIYSKTISNRRVFLNIVQYIMMKQLKKEVEF